MMLYLRHQRIFQVPSCLSRAHLHSGSLCCSIRANKHLYTVSATDNRIQSLCIRMSKNRRHKRPAVRISRGDLPTGRKGNQVTNNILVTTTAEDLQLGKYVSSVSTEGNKESVVTVTFRIEKCGVGYFIEGWVKTTLRLLCSRCPGSFNQPIDTRFEVWANASARSADDNTDPAMKPLRRGANYLDLSEDVIDAIDVALPRIFLCASENCGKGAVSGLGPSKSKTGWTSPIHSDVANQFAVLKSLKDELNAKEQNRPVTER